MLGKDIQNKLNGEKIIFKSNKKFTPYFIAVAVSITMVVVLMLVAISGAWFFTQDRSDDVDINIVYFGAGIQINPECDCTDPECTYYKEFANPDVVYNLRFRLPNSTKIDCPDSVEIGGVGLLPHCSNCSSFDNGCADCIEAYDLYRHAHWSRDRYFNRNVFVTRVVITNTGEIPLRPSVIVRPHNPSHTCAACPQEYCEYRKSPLRSAIFFMDYNDIGSLQIDNTASTIYNPDVPDFRHHIWQGLNGAIDSTGYPITGNPINNYPANLEQMDVLLNYRNDREGELSVSGTRVVLNPAVTGENAVPAESVEFILVTWVDYRALILYDHGLFAPNPDTVSMRNFGLQLTIRAEQVV